jgi:Arc/MetJ-type ribon-helix-helix transcriptional regulator
MTSQEFSKELEQIARPLVEAGIYASEEAFVRDIVKDMATKRVRTYEGAVRKYRAKHGSLEQFGAKIKGKASPSQEDAWMEWEAAEGMLKAWKKVAKS